MANVKVSLLRGAAVLSVALGAGHLVQMKAAPAAPDQPVVAIAPQSVVTLSATAEDAGPALAPPAVAASALPSPALPSPVLPPLVRLPQPTFPPVAGTAKPQPAAPDVAAAPAPCTPDLALSELPGAIIGVTVLATCNPDQRIVLRHAGLAVTGQISASGVHVSALPALLPQGEVTVLFADGTRLSAQIDMPAAAGLRRFAIQWQADDALSLNAFENGAVFYGATGHVSATNPASPEAGATGGGFLTVLGDASVDLPLLAQVYTYPPAETAEIVVEAEVTPATCGCDLLGEMLMSADGSVTVEELTLAMPDCSAVGDYLVLKNLAADMKIAAVR